jgi:hypothetical protein
MAHVNVALPLGSVVAPRPKLSDAQVMLRDTKRVWEAESRRKYATRISQAPRLPSSSARPAKAKPALKAKVSLAKRREFSAAGSAKLKEEHEAGESSFQIWRSGTGCMKRPCGPTLSRARKAAIYVADSAEKAKDAQASAAKQKRLQKNFLP